MTTASKPNHIPRALLIAGALTLAAFGAFAQDASAQSAAPWALSEHQKGIAGPIKLRMAQADGSGLPNANPGFIADRQAILNHMTAYAYTIDEGRWDAWYDLFADDVTLEITSPCAGTIIARGKEAMKAFTDLRYGKTVAMRRHTMGNVHVASQTATTAEVRSYMLISSVPNADKLNVLTTGSYNATMEKRDGRWITTRWYIEVDAVLAMSQMPTNVPPGSFSFVPDAREACAARP